MAEWRLERQIDKARFRWIHLRLTFGAACVWLAGLLLAGAVLLVQNSSSLSFPFAAESIIAMATVGCLFVAWNVWRVGRDRRLIAQRIEAAFPDLQSSLLAALDVEPDRTTGSVGYLQDQVIGKALSHAYQTGWQRAIPASRLAAAHGFQFALLSLFVICVLNLFDRQQDSRIAQQSVEADEILTAGNDFNVQVEPGNTEVERGTALLVLARFQGQLPPDAKLVFRSENLDKSGDEEPKEISIPMSKALDDPLFGGSIPSVKAPLDYHVEFAGKRSDSYRVGVFEFPRLVKADAQLRFPKYTSMEDKLVQDVRQLSAVIGTSVTVILTLNKSVAEARLTEKDGSGLDLKPVAEKPNQYMGEFVLDRTRRFSVQLVDDKQRKNKETAELVFTAIANRPPDLKLAAPGKDTQVSPLEELEVKAKAFDDFGLHRVGLTYLMAGQEEQELTLAQNIAAKEKLELAHVVALEKLSAEPDQLLSYYVWAEDAGPDGSIRRTSSDMYFAEIRPFEEIFRQGQQPAGGEQQQQQQANQNANAAEKLAELQKEIINATWKLIRRETGAKMSDAFGSDVALLVESQNSALQQTEKLAEEVRDPQSMRHVDEARRHMNEAIAQLIAAKEKDTASVLKGALDAEQQAYQSLLKLRAREHQVVRSQRQPGASSSSSSSRSQQQLDQLELKDQKNRYENQRTAQPPQDPAEREMRQVLNRLKELARRQGDLNDRLKEVQTALQEAQTEEQKEELRRQLKRLQEEQEQLLRDTEELQARMDQPENAERMAESRQQLDNARERVRQSSEALREGMVPQAASAGARAKEDFEQLRDDFRKKTSDRFQQEARELSEQARELDEREQEIAEKLKQLDQPQPGNKKSLRENNEREKLIDNLAEQKHRSTELMDRMRQTIQDAESPQPLLAEQLYDTVRRVQQQNLSQNLENTQEGIRRGLMEPAKQYEEQARNTITELRAGIDRAAQSVLEDETEALRRAQRELRELSEQLGDELARNGQTPPESNPQDNGDESQAGNPAEKGNENSKSATGQKQSSESQGQQKSNASSKGKGSANSEQKSGGSSESSTGEKSDEPKSEESTAKGQKGSGGKSKEERPGDQQGDSQGKGDPSEPSAQKSEAQGKGSGGGKGDGKQDSRGNPSQSSREPSPGGNESPGENGNPSQNQTPNGSQSPNGNPSRGLGSLQQLAGPSGGGGGNERMLSPFTGENFREWSDRLRDVEEMLGDPELSSEAARIRERARSIRADSRRHSAPPNWDLVKVQVAEPLAELLDRVQIEVLKRTKSEMLVPLDRDPVPPAYADQVRKYYERLGSGR